MGGQFALLLVVIIMPIIGIYSLLEIINHIFCTTILYRVHGTIAV